MDRDFLIKVTNNLYHLTLLFPKKEPLRYKMRELADEILANCLKVLNNADALGAGESVSELLEDLEILDSYFAIANDQSWVTPPKLFSVQEEYSKIKGYLEGLNKESAANLQLPLNQENRQKNNSEGPKTLNGRQEKILEVLGQKEKARVGELKEFFPDITKRTLRRDFRQLLKDGKLERIGERNETYYRISDRT